MKEVLQVVADMETALNHSSEPYESFPTSSIFGSVLMEDPTIRLRTGSISSARSRSNSILGKDRSRHASVSE